jgi:hypothetical protein
MPARNMRGTQTLISWGFFWHLLGFLSWYFLQSRMKTIHRGIGDNREAEEESEAALDPLVQVRLVVGLEEVVVRAARADQIDAGADA